jgi:hypothetical protein
MAIKNIICQGVGFSPGSVKFMPTLGFTPAAAAAVTVVALVRHGHLKAGHGIGQVGGVLGIGRGLRLREAKAHG